MFNGNCIEPDGSVLPAELKVKEDDLLGTLLIIKDYHGNTTTFITSKEELSKLLAQNKERKDTSINGTKLY